MSHKNNPYIELKQQIGDDLCAQQPEWVELTGDCPTCESHLSGLSQLLDRVANTIVRRKAHSKKKRL